MDKLGRKRDDHGHVIGNDETDGQECRHTTGGDSVKGETQKDGKLFKTQGEKHPLNDAGEVVDESLDFDADYDEEFEDKEKINPESEFEYKVTHIADEYENVWNASKSAEDVWNEVKAKYGRKIADAVNNELEDRYFGNSDNDDEYEREMKAAQNENADMSEDDNEESKKQTGVDAMSNEELYETMKLGKRAREGLFDKDDYYKLKKIAEKYQLTRDDLEGWFGITSQYSKPLAHHPYDTELNKKLNAAARLDKGK